MSLPIPAELVEHAIDSLHNDVHALAACALASRALLPRARFHIWRKVTLLVDGDPLHARIQGLLKILDTSPDIAHIVQSLTLNGTGVASSEARNRIHDYWDDPEGAMLLWEKLPNLRILKFVLLSFHNGLYQLIPFACSLPNLEELALIGFDAAPKTVHPASPPSRNSLVQSHTPPKLKRLSLTAGRVSWLFLEDLAKVLLEPGMHAPLETLDLFCSVASLNSRVSPRYSTDAVFSQAWAPVIASLAQTLRHCTLGLLTEDCSPANPAHLYGSLKRCTHLRSLSLVCFVHPTDTVGHRPSLFLDALADLLLSPADSPPPFPRFETLSVELLQDYELVLDGCADACAKLADALGDRTRYPHLKRVAICAKTLEQHSGPIDDNLSVGEELKEQEALCRSCFGRMEAVGVQVEISIGGPWEGYVSW
ncbi:hypothetical protein GSI_13331 [Ganoderma sinense ZZ0214-1]|uniref:F-box domain-containing protein n=1 Tax=Ganoderma sinense ZZ0214-1 TaxID=1077348 RepID=A0A2G8RVA5_9APHY|nr:hypothetical protein GSI_13331 [Ganoderma sinense ZZ0214-1]